MQPASSDKMSLIPVGVGKPAFSLIPGGAVGGTLAKDSGRTPLPDASPRGWDLQAWEAGREVLCPSQGSCLRRAAHPVPAGEGAWGMDRTRDEVSRVGILEGPGSTASSAGGTTDPGLGLGCRARLDRE